MDIDDKLPNSHRHSRKGGNLLLVKRVSSGRDPRLSPRMTETNLLTRFINQTRQILSVLCFAQ